MVMCIKPMCRAHPRVVPPWSCQGPLSKAKASKHGFQGRFVSFHNALQGFHGPNHPENHLGCMFDIPQSHSQNLGSIWKGSDLVLALLKSRNYFSSESSVAKSWEMAFHDIWNRLRQTFFLGIWTSGASVGGGTPCQAFPPSGGVALLERGCARPMMGSHAMWHLWEHSLGSLAPRLQDWGRFGISAGIFTRLGGGGKCGGHFPCP